MSELQNFIEKVRCDCCEYWMICGATNKVDCKEALKGFRKKEI